MNKNDILWKGVLEDFFEDFLLFFFPNANEIFDLSKKFEFLDKELQQLFPQPDDLRHPKYVDTLVKVFAKPDDTGIVAEHWILVHVEVQGYEDPHFTERLFTYFYRIRDRYGKNITTFAIFTDNNPLFHPKEYTYNFLGTSNLFRFNTYKVLDQNTAELTQSDNPFAIVVLTVLIALQKKKDNEWQLLELSKELVRNLFRKNFGKERIAYLLNFIKMYVNFEKPEVVSKFDEEVKSIDPKTKETMGIMEQVLFLSKWDARIEGKQEGRIEKEKSFTKSLILETDFDDQKIAHLVGVKEEFVRDLRSESLQE